MYLNFKLAEYNRLVTVIGEETFIYQHKYIFIYPLICLYDNLEQNIITVITPTSKYMLYRTQNNRSGLVYIHEQNLAKYLTS